MRDDDPIAKKKIEKTFNLVISHIKILKLKISSSLWSGGGEPASAGRLPVRVSSGWGW